MIRKTEIIAKSFPQSLILLVVDELKTMYPDVQTEVPFFSQNGYELQVVLNGLYIAAFVVTFMYILSKAGNADYQAWRMHQYGFKAGRIPERQITGQAAYNTPAFDCFYESVKFRMQEGLRPVIQVYLFTFAFRRYLLQ